MAQKIIKPIKDLTAGQYGEAVAVSVVDSDGNAFDLSTYTSMTIRAISKDAQKTLSFTGAFVESTAGTLTFTPSSTNTFDRDGEWELQIQFSDTTVPSLVFTDPLIVEVGSQI